MGFAVFVEALNIRATRRSEPVALHDPYHEKEPPGGGATPPKPSDDDPAPGAAPA